jgi:hypothetical protein
VKMEGAGDENQGDSSFEQKAARLIHPGWAAKWKIVGSIYNGREVGMRMTERVTATEADAEKASTGKLMEDLKSVGAQSLLSCLPSLSLSSSWGWGLPF